MQFRGTPLRVTVESSELTIVALAGGYDLPIKVGFGEEVRELRPGEGSTFTIPAGGLAQ